MFKSSPLREKYLYLKIFCFVFSRIPTEYGNLQGKSPFSAKMRKNKDDKNFEYGHFLRNAQF